MTYSKSLSHHNQVAHAVLLLSWTETAEWQQFSEACLVNSTDYVQGNSSDQ